jgi:cytochrome c553
MAYRTFIVTLACWTGLATAGPQDILTRYSGEMPGFTPSADRGRAIFQQSWPASPRLPRCTTCHGTDLSQPGRHAITGKVIAAMLPAAEPTRLTDFRKTEKWFRRNCKEVVGRECTAGEKADVVKYLMEGGRV